MDELAGIRMFVRVVEGGSFVAAARGLGLSKSVITKRVKELEDRLKAQLLVRSTRRLTLTDAGASYFERCVRIVAELGGDPFDQLHPIAGPTNQEVGQFWHGSPALQAKILELFHDAGAVAAVASDKPADVSTPPGWQHVDDTNTWVYLFR